MQILAIFRIVGTVVKWIVGILGWIKENAKVEVIVFFLAGGALNGFVTWLVDVGYLAMHPVERGDLNINLLFLAGPVMLAIFAGIIKRRRSKGSGAKQAEARVSHRPAGGTSKGSARWRSDFSDLDRVVRGETSSGLVLGRSKSTGEVVTTERDFEGHLLTFGANRSGKGVGQIIPNLLTGSESFFVLDPKGELFQITARQRQRLGSEPVALDPFGVLGKDEPRSLKMNPLHFIDADSPRAIDQAKSMARQIVPRGTHSSKNSHFDDTARQLVRSLLLYAASSQSAHERTLPFLWDSISNFERWETLLDDMEDSTRYAGAIAGGANRYRHVPERERGSIRSTLVRQMDFLESLHMRDHLTPDEGEGVNLRDLRQKNKTVYVCLPPARVRDYKEYVRVVLGGVVESLCDTRNAGGRRVTLLLDEVAQLDKMETLDRGAGILAGYSVRLWFFFQSLGQFYKAYGKEEGITGNALFVNYLGVAAGDDATAEKASKDAGKATVVSSNWGESTGTSGERFVPFHTQGNEGSSRGGSEDERSLITPNEVKQLRREMLMLQSYRQPAKLDKIRYYEDPEFAGTFDKRPNL